MPNTATIAPVATFNISHDDIRRFQGVATISDEAGFTSALTAFLLEKLQFAKKPARPNTKSTIHTQIREKAASLRSEVAWQPSETDLQRGRQQMLDEFNAPHNLPLVQFAKLANKSRQQLYKDVSAKRILALSIGHRGLRLPDWQLGADALELTRKLLASAHGVDEWTLFHALSAPLESLQGVPVAVVNQKNLNKVYSALMNELGLHE